MPFELIPSLKRVRTEAIIILLVTKYQPPQNIKHTPMVSLKWVNQLCRFQTKSRYISTDNSLLTIKYLGNVMGMILFRHFLYYRLYVKCLPWITGVNWLSRLAGS